MCKYGNKNCVVGGRSRLIIWTLLFMLSWFVSVVCTAYCEQWSDTCVPVCVVESVHPAVRNICQLQWLPVDSKAVDDVACKVFVHADVSAHELSAQVHICGLKFAIVNLDVFGVHVHSHTGFWACVFVLCLSVCLCELVCVSSRALYSPDSWHGWFGSQSVKVTIEQQLLPPTLNPLRLSAHLSLPPRPRSQILWHIASNSGCNYWVILQWPLRDFPVDFCA